MIDAKGVIINLNRFAEDLIGEKKEKILTRNLSDFIEGEKNVLQSILNKSGNEEFPQSIEVKFIRKNKKSFYTILSINNYLNAKSNQDLFIVSVVDLTNQKMNAELIKESQIRFENISNSAPVMIWITDVSGFFIFVNNIWADFTGRTIGEELGLNWIQDVHPDEINSLMDVYRNALDSRTQFSFEFRFKRKDNVYRWLMIHGVPRLNAENDFLGLIGTCTDITNQKGNEEFIKKISSSQLYHTIYEARYQEL